MPSMSTWHSDKANKEINAMGRDNHETSPMTPPERVPTEQRSLPHNEQHVLAAHRATVHIRDLLETIIFYVGLPLATLYPLGALFYWIQLRRDFEINSQAAWQGVVLIPEQFVVSQFSWQLVFGRETTTFLPVILIAVSVAILIALKESRNLSERLRAHSILRTVVLLLIVVLLAVLASNLLLAVYTFLLEFDLIARFVDRTYVSPNPLSLFARLANVGFVTLNIAGGVLTGVLIAKDYQKHKDSKISSREHLSSLTERRWMLRGFIVAYAGSAFFALVGALLVQHPYLSCVDFHQVKQLETNSLKGYLLADPSSVSGYWHILVTDSSGTRIEAIPSEWATEVTIIDTSKLGDAKEQCRTTPPGGQLGR
jgi:hypothetical protein